MKKVFNYSPIHWLFGYDRYEVENIGSVFVYDINKKELAPGSKTNIYVKRSDKGISYSDFDGDIKVLKSEN